MKEFHERRGKTSAGRLLSLESRTAMTMGEAAVSTQLPVPSLLYVDLYQASSGAISVEG